MSGTKDDGFRTENCSEKFSQIERYGAKLANPMSVCCRMQGLSDNVEGIFSN